MLTVMKFGGTSLADKQRIRAAAGRIAARVEQGDQVVAVVSAPGDTTDHLLQQAKKLSADPSERELDALLSIGEQCSASMLALALISRGCPAVSLTGAQAGLVTDGVHGNARVLGLRGDRVRQILERGNTAVVAGFQGVNSLGDVTTLGRGGSDTTAVALAAFLQADECRIYTDVDGIYDKDPRRHPDAVKYDIIGYEQMLAMARQGAQVLHDRCVELAMQYRVPIRVLSSFRSGEGTWVTDIPQ